MRYSVWNYGTRAYDYFESPDAPATHAGTPPVARRGLLPLRNGEALGATPDQAAWPLPKGARKVGAGVIPQGKIATLGDVSDLGSSSWLEIGLAAGALWWLFFRKKRRA